MPFPSFTAGVPDYHRHRPEQTTLKCGLLECGFLLAAEPEALTAVLAVVQRAISTFVIRHSGRTVASGARTGAVTLIQRFGSALNLNIHLHMLFLDGAYTFQGNRPTFHRARRHRD